MYAVDASTWPRSDAETSPERGFYYHASRHSAGQPIVAGWSYQWIAGLSFAPDSWTAPLDVVRLSPLESTVDATLAQVRRAIERLGPDGPVPQFVFDAGYDPIALSAGLADLRASICVRIRDNRLFYADPVPPPSGTVGRPKRHGARFSCADLASWPTPDAALACDDPRYGRVEVAAWHALHPKLANRGRWVGAHAFRFVKHTLGWTTPALRMPEQADRRTWLVAAAYTELRPARSLVDDRRLPWERPATPDELTPARVRRGFRRLRASQGTRRCSHSDTA